MNMPALHADQLPADIDQLVYELLWPRPPDDMMYVGKVLPGGDYLSTGQFPRAVIGPSGGGRTVDNCARVTSLMWDADLVTLYEALLVARRRPVPSRRQQLKAALWRLPTDHITKLKEVLLQQLVPVWSDVMGMEPTAVFDSGWGVHIHLAVDPSVGGNVVELAGLHADVTRRMNERVAGVARELRPSLRVPTLFDRLTVGAQLARIPGSINKKCCHIPMTVVVLDCNPDSALDAEEMERLGAMTGMSDDMFADFGNAPKPGGYEHEVGPPHVGPPPPTEADFTQQYIDGRTWADIAYALSPGERVKVRCPFGGTSIGSGFFARESDGRTRYYSHPLQRTFWDCMVRQAPRSQRTVRLAMLPRKGDKPPRPQNTLSNLRLMVANDPAFDLWLDDFTGEVMDGDSPLPESWWLDTRIHMESAYNWTWSASREVLMSTAMAVATDNRRNRPREWLLSLRWDKQPRLKTWMHKALGAAAGNGLVTQYSLRWPIALVARMLDPGVKQDSMLVLQGPQGSGKSQALEAWVDTPVQPGMFVDTRVRLDDKDAMLVLRRAWLYEDAELLAHGGAGAAARKAFLSSRVDTFRPPYGRTVIRAPRHCVVCGSTNDAVFLHDVTGSRRYFVVPTGKINLRWLRDNRDQLLAEAVHLYRKGEPWWLSRSWEEKQSQLNKRFLYTSSYATAATALFEKAPAGAAFTLESCLQVLGAGVGRDSRMVTSALELAGFTRARTGTWRGWAKPVDERMSWPDRRAAGSIAIGQLADIWREMFATG